MDDLLNTLGSGTTLLTPNRRLARTLTEAYGVQRQAAGDHTWETPDILPWSAWLQRCWNEAGQHLAMAGQPVPGLLTPLQERVLWEQIIRDAGEEHTHLQPVGAARLAQEAWQLLHGWRLDLHQAEFALSEDARAFHTWAQAYAKRSQEADWLDDARLPQWLQTCLLGPVSLREVWPRLRRLAAETLFQPRSPAAPVQVLGVLEAAGLNFDYLWVMGLHDEVWPPVPQPHPFLPPGLQRRHHLPRSSAERELAMAGRLTRRMLTAAPNIVISYPCLEGERELRPSPLIRSIPAISSLDLPQHQDYAQLLYARRKLETWQETHGPAVDQIQVQGGSALLQAQAACPFRAFATYRLNARPLANPQPGLDPLARGILAHAVLRRLWTGADSILLDLDEADRDERIRQASEQALTDHPVPLGERLKALEMERLTTLTREWLNYEGQRPGTFSVQVEATQTISLSGLELTLRMDRVDTLADGRVVIIDYKTGDCRQKDWEGERPKAPQLPLYALTREPEKIAGIAFAQVQAGTVKFIGLAQGADLLPDVVGDFQEQTWPALIQDWQAVLTGLAENYRQGHAQVDPLEPGTCDYCALTPLCRIHEQGSPHEQ